MVLVHAVPKWVHYFTSDDGPNPLVSALCRNMIVCLPVSKKKPVDADVVKSIIDRFGAD